MEQQGIITTHLREFQEVITVLGRFIVKGDADITHRCFQQHFGG
jgi:hypothetical protein